MHPCFEAAPWSTFFRRAAVLTLLAAGMGLIGITAADAARAVATASVNVRAGPGTNHRVVGRLVTGERVGIARCNRPGTWCRIERRRGRDGWVSSRYLTHRGGGGHNRPWIGNHRPPANSICFHGAHGRICVTR